MSEKEIRRLQKWRLGVIPHAMEVTHNVAKHADIMTLAELPSMIGTKGTKRKEKKNYEINLDVQFIHPELQKQK